MPYAFEGRCRGYDIRLLQCMVRICVTSLIFLLLGKNDFAVQLAALGLAISLVENL